MGGAEGSGGEGVLAGAGAVAATAKAPAGVAVGASGSGGAVAISSSSSGMVIRPLSSPVPVDAGIAGAAWLEPVADGTCTAPGTPPAAPAITTG